jgi:hypothetical protein
LCEYDTLSEDDIISDNVAKATQER